MASAGADDHAVIGRAVAAAVRLQLGDSLLDVRGWLSRPSQHDRVAVRLERWLRARDYEDAADRVA